MIVTYKNNKLIEISTVDELDLFIKDGFYVNFKKTPDYLRDEVLNLINTIQISKIKFERSIRRIFSQNNKFISTSQIEYWLNRGYNTKEADALRSSSQKKSSKRCIEYWLKSGYSIDDAKIQISKFQSSNGNYNKHKTKKELRLLSNRCVEYWINKGFTNTEAKEIISKRSASFHIEYWKTATDAQKDKQRLTGDKNGMYGKTPPKGSGNGWSGWVHGVHFRSLLELNYLVNVLNRFNIKFESAETKKYRIKYISHDGVKRTYSADYFIADKYLVEVKPKLLWNSKIVQLKKQAAEQYCNEHGLKYKLIDPGKMKKLKLLYLYENGIVTFMDRYDSKVKKYLNI